MDTNIEIKTKHGHSSSRKSKSSKSSKLKEFKEDNLLLSEEIKEESSFSSSEFSPDSSSVYSSYSQSVQNEEIKEEAIEHPHHDGHPLFPGQKWDIDPEPKSSDIPETFTKGFIKNVIADDKFNITTLVVRVKNLEFVFVVNNETIVKNGSEQGSIDDLAPSQTIVFVLGKNSIISDITIVAGILVGRVAHIESNLLSLHEFDKKK